MSPYRIVLVDDHLLFRRGIKRILEDKEGIRVIGEAGDGLELLDILKKVETDLIILDISMPNLRGIEVACETKKNWPNVKILVLSMHKDQDFIYHAFSAGVDGYIVKDDSDTELFSAIDRIQKGEFYLSPTLSTDYKGKWSSIFKQVALPTNDVLSSREIEVLKLVAEGKKSREIAELLFVSKRTIDAHRSNILKKIKAKNIAELTKYAISKGYIANLC